MVGGGLAGLTAALDLAEAGVATTLVERRPFVGGKTYSFDDGGVELDNGQHIYLRCCTAYLDLIDRLGLNDCVRTQPRLRVPVLDPASGRISPIAGGPLPAPLHLSASILSYSHLRWGEKLQLGRAVLPMLRMGAEGRRRLDGESFGAWLRARGQSQRVIDRFWDLIVLPTCNDVADNVSARQAIMVFQVGLLWERHAGEIGFATVGLSRIAEAALARLREAGGRALLGRTVRGLEHEDDRTSGVRFADGERVGADAVVLALPPNHARALLPEAWRAHPALASLEGFAYAPIVNVHVQLADPVMDELFCAVLDPDVQYVFNRSRITGTSGEGSGSPARSAAPSARARSSKPISPRARSRGCAGLSPQRAEWRCCAGAWSRSRRRPSARSPAPTRGGWGRRLPTATCCWRARGPTRSGRPRWNRRCAAVTSPRGPGCRSAQPGVRASARTRTAANARDAGHALRASR